jgi:hypothetical protein
VRASLEAALADADAADVVRSGQLVKPIGYGGLAEAMATPSAPARSRRGSAKTTAKGGGRQPVAVATPAKVKAAKDAVSKAERQVAAARAKLEKAQRRQQEADAHADDVRKDVADLKRFLNNRQADLKMAERNAETARNAHTEATQKAEQAERELDAARAAFADLA